MHRAGPFTPAWLWTVLDVVRQTHHLGEVRIGGSQFDPLPVTLPRNCEHCTRRVLAAIDRYNLTYELASLTGLECEHCTAAYHAEMARLAVEIDEVQLRRALTAFAQQAPPQGLVGR